MSQNDTVETEVEELSKPATGLLKSSGIVACMTFISRMLGLSRDIVIAALFGAGAGADAFFVAFKIPNFLRRLFAEGAFSQAFVPVLAEYRQQCSLQEVKNLVDNVAGYLGGILLSITVVAVIGAPVLAMIFAPGFRGYEEKMALTVEMLRITFPYLLLISLTGFAGAILNSCGRFAVPAITPALLNISLIGSAFLLSPYLADPIVALAWGVLIAGFAQLLFQLPFLHQVGLFPQPKLVRKHEGVRRIVKLMLPAIFGVSVSQINLLLDTLLASFLVTGSVSWLYFSDRLVELPLGIFAIAIATVILPSLSRKHADKSTEEFSATLDWALRLVLLVGLPAALALSVLAQPLLVTLFQHGEFSAQSVLQTSLSLRAYAFGLLAFMFIKVLAPGYFARMDTATPVKYGIIAMASNMVLNLVLVFPFAHVGLALATSLSAFLNAGLLFYGLYRLGVYRFQCGWVAFLFKLIVANGCMLGFLFYVRAPFDIWLEWDLWSRIMNLGLLCLGGGAIYIVMLIVCGLRPRHLQYKGTKGL